MTARQIRRAAERQAFKEARKEANRSTGPVTLEGKAISSRNALKTALTGRTVLLPTDDRAAYETHVSGYFEKWQPSGEHECTLVQTLADTWWRLSRIPVLEMALYAKGRLEIKDKPPELLEIEIYLLYEKQFRNLALQERRLSNYAARLTSELQELQSERQFEFSTTSPAKIDNPATPATGRLTRLGAGNATDPFLASPDSSSQTRSAPRSLDPTSHPTQSGERQ